MNQKYKKIIFFGVLGGLFLTFIFGLKLSLAQSVSINYSNFKNLLYNFLNQECPSGMRVTQCNVYSVFYQANYSDIINYKTRLYNAKTDDEIKTVLTEFFSEYCTPNYTDTKEFSKQSSASTLKFFCDCWSSPDENCTNLVNSLGPNLPPNSTWVGGPVSVSNVITNYVAGENFKREDTSCQNDLNIGFLDFFHNPISWLLRVIFWIFEQLLKLVADVFIWLLTPANFGGFVNFQPVRTIWRISLNLANLGIILGFLIMAIATILKIEKYSWDKMLWRLVLVALLINFSLVLCGIFVDLSNFLTIYFLTGAGNQMLSFKDILVSTATSIACAGAESQQGFLYESSSALIGILVVIIFIGQIIGLISYTAVRIITLWLTLGLSPLFFLSLAFPGLEKIADSWKNYFTQAIVSLPVIAFSFFIILVMLNQIALSFVFVQKGEFFQKIIPMISFGIIIIALSQAVLIIAGSLGIQQIQKGYQFVTKLAWGAAGVVAGWGLAKTGRAVVSSDWYKKVAERLEKSMIGPLHNLGVSMKGVTSRVREKELANLEKKAASMSTEDLNHALKQYDRWKDKYSAAVIFNELAKRGKIEDGNLEHRQMAEKLKDHIDPRLLKKSAPTTYQLNYAKEEDKEAAEKEAKLEAGRIASKYGFQEGTIQYKQVLQEEYEKALLKSFIEKAESDDLRNIKWDSQITQYPDLLRILIKDAKINAEAIVAMMNKLDTAKTETVVQEIEKALLEERGLDPEKATSEERLRAFEEAGYTDILAFRSHLTRHLQKIKNEESKKSSQPPNNPSSQGGAPTPGSSP